MSSPAVENPGSQTLPPIIQQPRTTQPLPLNPFSTPSPSTSPTTAASTPATTPSSTTPPATHSSHHAAHPPRYHTIVHDAALVHTHRQSAAGSHGDCQSKLIDTI